jgi:tetrahydromethanopterin S-methyltransferase subunit G
LLERLLGMELDDLEELEKKIDSIENRVNKLERLVSEILLEL